jgi:hypothetical protein
VDREEIILVDDTRTEAEKEAYRTRVAAVVVKYRAALDWLRDH